MMSPSVLVRREVRSLGPTDQTLAAYASAVAAMKQRPDADPTSWAFQAALHGTVDQPLRGQNQCQHATWFFVSWHRMFVFYFEQIVRAAVVATGGPADWTLPYWNYELGGDHATIPSAFRSQTVNGQPNPLYVSERAPGINAGHALPSAATTSRNAIRAQSFTGATEFGGGVTPVLFQNFDGPTGELEATPHNAVHGVVGGWMNNPDLAARDPIFWLHHANIDRLWTVWIRNGHSNPSDPSWLNQAFSFFDVEGQPVSMTAAQVLDTVADLGYTYDQFETAAPAPPAAAELAGPVTQPKPPTPELVGTTAAPLKLVGQTQSTTVPLDQRAQKSALTTLATTTPRIILQVHEVQAERTPDTVYGVYVNLPVGAPPSQEPLHHVGNLSFFGVERAREPRGDEHPHGLSLSFDISELADAQRASGHWSDSSVTITFKPLRLIPPEDADPAITKADTGEEPPATVGSISIFYA